MKQAINKITARLAHNFCGAKWHWLLLAPLLSLSLSIQAQWISAVGEAAIIDGNLAAAKAQATREAVKQALLNAGASISSLQQVQNGIITQDKFEVRSDGEIRQIITHDEQISANKVTIYLQVDVVKSKEQCQFSNYAKSISQARFSILDRQQATHGQLFAMGREFSKRLYKELELMPHKFDPRQWIDAVMPFDPAKMVDPVLNNRNKLFSLSQSADSQFIILGIIDDLSIQDDKSLLDAFWFTSPPRNFSVTLYVFDGMTGERIFNKQYKATAQWDYQKTEAVDLNSSNFWQSHYGLAITHLFDEMVIDLELATACIQPLARVVSVSSDSIQINLGKRNGIKLGDRFALYHNAGFIDQFGHIRSQVNNAQYGMEVSRVYQGNTILTPIENYPMNNIQLNDLAKLNR